MKRIISVIVLLLSVNFFSQNFQEFRALMKAGETSENSAKMLIQKSEKEYVATKKPIYKGFLAVGNFFLAKHSYNPIKKMSYFKEGQKLMNDAVKKDPNNIEIRLMRLISQEKTPKFLGYSQNIAEDRKYLTTEYTKSSDDDLKKYIKNYLKL